MANRVNIGAARIPDVAKLPLVALPTVGLRGVAGGGTGGYWPAGTPEAIRQSCMLWYDVARQGCTNEAMAADPVLRDLSGNGHDATCYNFAWAGMSGVGGYELSLTEFVKMPSDDFLSSSRYECLIAEGNPYLLYTSGSKGHPAFRVKVSGLSQPLKYSYSPSADSETVATFTIPSDGEYEMPQSFANDKIAVVGFYTRQAGLVIELVPLYPGALVSDGVDDYCLVEGLPLLTRENGYTVIAKRKNLTSNQQSCLASKRNSASPNGAFVFELYANGYRADSFGYQNGISLLEESDISYQTSKSYNEIPIQAGEELDNNVLNLFNLSGNYLANVALYSFVLFNRDLTKEEIEWVKTNMMQQ